MGHDDGRKLGHDDGRKDVMEIDAWVAAAIADAERRGLPELRPLIEALAQATRALRDADVPRQEPVPGDTRPQ